MANRKDSTAADAGQLIFARAQRPRIVFLYFAAVHRLLAQHKIPTLVVWCDEISRHVKPEMGVVRRQEGLWDLLRTHIAG